MRNLFLAVALVLCSACSTHSGPSTRVVYSDQHGIALQSSPGGAVHYYQFKRRKR